MDDAALKFARELIRRPSVTPRDGGCQKLIAARLSNIGFRLEHMRFGDVDNLWARRGRASPLLVFAGHTDVVTPGEPEDWKCDPFVPTIENGMLYGRGAADMKTSLAAFVIAMERFVSLHPDHAGSLGLLITSDEEGPAVDGTARVVEELQRRNERIDYCVVGEPTADRRTGDTIKNGRRGSLSATAVVFGVQGHVAYPHLAVNPIHRFSPVLEFLTKKVWDSGDAYFPPTSFQVTSLRSGTGANNVVPGRLEVEFNFRFSNAVSPDHIKALVQSTFEEHELEYDIDWTLSGLPYFTVEGKLTNVAQKAVREHLHLEPILSTDGGTSDGRFIAPTGAQVVELGPSNKTIHKVNECVTVDDPEQLSRLYLSIMKQLLL